VVAIISPTIGAEASNMEKLENKVVNRNVLFNR